MDAVMKLLEEQPLFVGAAVVFVVLILYSNLAGSASSEKAEGTASKSDPKAADTAANGPSKKKTRKPRKKNKKSAEDAGGAATSVEEPVEEEKKEPEEPKPKKHVTIVEQKTKELPPTVEEPAKESKKKKKKQKKKKTATASAPVEKENSTKTSEEPAKAEDSDDDDEDDFARILSKKQLEKTVGKSGAAKLNAKQKKEEEKQQEEWVTVNKGSNASSAAAAAVEESSPKDISETIPLGPDDPALVIGPKGATIQGIQSSSGAKVDVKKAAPGAASSLTITGKESEVASAKQQIMALIESAAEEKRLATAHSVTLSGKDIKGSDGVKSIIGKGGATIKNIQSKTQTSIDADVEAGSVVITGRTDEQVNEAATLCKHAVFGESQHVIELGTRSMVMVIYGKDFAKIKQMQTESGAKLDIDRGSTTLKLSGSTEAVRKAKEMIEQWMEFCKGETVEIEASKVGAVYGKQGQTIRRIQERTGAFVEVNDTGRKGSDMVPCRIMGEPEAVKEALVLFQKAVAGEIELKPGEVMESMELGVGAPAVIGRGGSKIRDLETAHAVKLKINSESLCNIVGKPENVAKAKAAIEKVIQPLLEEQKAKVEADRLAAQGDPNWGGAWTDDGVPHASDGW